MYKYNVNDIRKNESVRDMVIRANRPKQEDKSRIEAGWTAIFWVLVLTIVFMTKWISG